MLFLFPRTNPVTLAVEEALGLQQDLVVGLLFRDALSEVGGVGVHLSYVSVQPV